MGKMLKITGSWVQAVVTGYLLWVSGAAAQKVYFECGAMVDADDTQGLILSPGFPYNYSSGIHCVWQFFVPVDFQLTLQLFDFDVFEGRSSPSKYISTPESIIQENLENTGPTGQQDALLNSVWIAKATVHHAQGRATKTSSQKEEVKQVFEQEQSTKMGAIKQAIKRSSHSLETEPSPLPPLYTLDISNWTLDAKKETYSSPQESGRGDGNSEPKMESSWSATPPLEPTSSEAPLEDTCPDDVLYISDLITFSSRFCGSKRPVGGQLAFGSSKEMVEVIMEFITTTPWGRGFAIVFHYHNRTKIEDHHFLSVSSDHLDTFMVALCGVAIFALVLTSVLCTIFRPKVCVKGATSSSSHHPEQQSERQNTRADMNELHLVTPGTAKLESSTENDNLSCSLSLSLAQTASRSVSAGLDFSHNPELGLSSGKLAELDLVTDEVFVISPGRVPGGPTSCPHTDSNRFLRHSDTGNPTMCDWLNPEGGGGLLGVTPVGGGGRIRPRAWSVRTFSDFLPPLPQLQRKWCSWNSASPFTKLVDAVAANRGYSCHGDETQKGFSDVSLVSRADRYPTESSASNASYLLAQRQRRLNSVSNLRRTRFATACFGLLSEGEAAFSCPLAERPSPELLEAAPPQASPVFAISEEEDRQPLVLTEYTGQQETHGTCQPINGLLQGELDWCHTRPDLPTAAGEHFPALIHKIAKQMQPQEPCQIAATRAVAGKEM